MSTAPPHPAFPVRHGPAYSTRSWSAPLKPSPGFSSGSAAIRSMISAPGGIPARTSSHRLLPAQTVTTTSVPSGRGTPLSSAIMPFCTRPRMTIRSLSVGNIKKTSVQSGRGRSAAEIVWCDAENRFARFASMGPAPERWISCVLLGYNGSNGLSKFPLRGILRNESHSRANTYTGSGAEG